MSAGDIIAGIIVAPLFLIIAYYAVIVAGYCFVALFFVIRFILTGVFRIIIFPFRMLWRVLTFIKDQIKEKIENYTRKPAVTLKKNEIYDEKPARLNKAAIVPLILVLLTASLLFLCILIPKLHDMIFLSIVSAFKLDIFSWLFIWINMALFFTFFLLLKLKPLRYGGILDAAAFKTASKYIENDENYELKKWKYIRLKRFMYRMSKKIRAFIYYANLDRGLETFGFLLVVLLASTFAAAFFWLKIFLVSAVALYILVSYTGFKKKVGFIFSPKIHKIFLSIKYFLKEIIAAAEPRKLAGATRFLAQVTVICISFGLVVFIGVENNMWQILPVIFLLEQIIFILAVSFAGISSGPEPVSVHFLEILLSRSKGAEMKMKERFDEVEINKRFPQNTEDAIIVKMQDDANESFAKFCRFFNAASECILPCYRYSIDLAAYDPDNSNTLQYMAMANNEIFFLAQNIAVSQSGGTIRYLNKNARIFKVFSKSEIQANNTAWDFEKFMNEKFIKQPKKNELFTGPIICEITGKCLSNIKKIATDTAKLGENIYLNLARSSYRIFQYYLSKCGDFITQIEVFNSVPENLRNYIFTSGAYEREGKAWWEYSIALGKNEAGKFAFRSAQEYFYRAKAAKFIDKMQPNFKDAYDAILEKRKEVLIAAIQQEEKEKYEEQPG